MTSGSLKALLAVLAVAGFQNRDKIAEILKGAVQPPETPATPGGPAGAQASDGTMASRPGGGGLDDLMAGLREGGLGSVLGGAGLGSVLGGGLNDLIDQFRQAGQQGKADSWVNTGANEPIDDNELQQALGPDLLREVAAQTGLSQEEVARRLAHNLPDAVDGLTPQGFLPQARRAL